MMKIEIYQIDPKRDEKQAAFLSLEHMEKILGTREVDSRIYNRVYAGDVDCRSLERVYAMFNLEQPDDFKGHSLSVSDVVRVLESPDVVPGAYFCDSFGFQEISFRSDQAELSPVLPIRVVLLESGKQARITHILPTLETMQRIVGGSIEAVYPFEERVCIVCNEEGKLEGLPLNRALWEGGPNGEILDILAGTCFLCDCSGVSFDSLSREQSERYLEQFRYPERFYRAGGTIRAVPVKDKDRER